MELLANPFRRHHIGLIQETKRATDGQGPERAVAFIGRRKEPGVGGPLGPLTVRPGWNVRLAFFPQDSRAAAPEYEIEVHQLDNGVVTRMVLDFHAFSVVLTLEKIEAVTSPSC